MVCILSTWTPSSFYILCTICDAACLLSFCGSVCSYDYTFYLVLLEEVKYFQILRLENWLQAKGYLQAIKIKYSVDEVEVTHGISEIRDTDEQIEYHPVWQTRKVHIRTPGISVQRGNRAFVRGMVGMPKATKEILMRMSKC